MRRIPRSLFFFESATAERVRIPTRPAVRCTACSLSTAPTSPTRLFSTSASKNENDYIQARTWAGLEWVGTDAWARKIQEPDEHINSNNFRPQIHSRSELKEAILNVVKETEHEGDWRSVSLEEPQVKISILARIQSQTGRRIPDIIIQNSSDTLGQLFDALEVRPAREKLADQLKSKKALRTLPNVTITKRRVSMEKKETKLGRWKYIQEELMARNLPISLRNTSGPKRH